MELQGTCATGRRSAGSRRWPPRSLSFCIETYSICITFGFISRLGSAILALAGLKFERKEALRQPKKIQPKSVAGWNCRVRVLRGDEARAAADDLIACRWAHQRRPGVRFPALSHRMYSLISLRNSTPLQNRQLVAYYYWLKYQVDTFVGLLTF